MAASTPGAGSIAWPGFAPHAGHEQAGRQPATVLNLSGCNSRAGMIVCCPTTTRTKGCPSDVVIAGQPGSVVLAGQVRSQDWRTRKAARNGKARLAEARAKLRTLIG